MLVQDCTSESENCQIFTAIIRSLSSNGQWFNFGALSDRTCYSKIRVFDGKTPILKAQVGVHTANEIGSTVSYTRAITDTGDSNGYCIAHICDNTFQSDDRLFFKGNLFAKKFGILLSPLSLPELTWPVLANSLDYKGIGNEISVSLYLRKNVTTGPFYDWEYPSWQYTDTCSYAPLQDFSFQFIATPTCEITHPNPLDMTIVEGNLAICNAKRLKQLYGFPGVLTKRVTSCYLKVTVSTTHSEQCNGQVFEALSMVGNAQNEYITVGTLYGFSQNCIEHGSTCLELKVPGSIACSIRERDQFVDEFTNVRVKPYNDTQFRVLEINSRFKQGDEILSLIHATNSTFTFSFIDSMVEGFGIFCNEAPTIEGEFVLK